MSTFVELIDLKLHLIRHATVKSEAIACARRCRSSRLTGWWKKNNQKKWRAEEERHTVSLTTKNTYLIQID
jgi:hypothetical protein